MAFTRRARQNPNKEQRLTAAGDSAKNAEDVAHAQVVDELDDDRRHLTDFKREQSLYLYNAVQSSMAKDKHALVLAQ